MTLPIGDLLNVALVIYRRPELTRKVLEIVHRVRPRKLFIIADGSTGSSTKEDEEVAASRNIVDEFDWPCVVEKYYSDSNLGCRNRITSGLNLVFEQVDRAIVLEDDCLPSVTFFEFCHELLERYESDERILSIGGSIWPFLETKSQNSYWFTNYPTSWGWCTWSRGWSAYQEAVESWPELRDTDWLERKFEGKGVRAQFWRHQLNEEFAMNSTWDYTWNIAHWIRDSFAIRPSANLVRNIGFGPEASRTRDLFHPAAKIEVQEISFPLVHPSVVRAEKEVEDFIEDTDHSGHIRRRMRHLLEIRKATKK